MTQPALNQLAYRLRDDSAGLNVDSGWLAALNSVPADIEVGTTFRARFVIEETNGKGLNNETPELWAQHNGGTWFQVTASSSVIQLVDDGQGIADNAQTTQLIGSGSYVTGESLGYNDGTTDNETGNIDFGGSDEAEVEHTLQIIADDVSDTDTILLRNRYAGGTVLEGYSQSPSITVNKPVPTYDQDSFQGYDDDAAEGLATTKAAVNTNWTQITAENFRLRFLLQNSGDTSTNAFKLQYNLNSGGWNDVTASSSVVQTATSDHIVDGADTTQQIGAGTFVTDNNGFDESDGATDPASFTTAAEIETEHSLILVHNDLSESDSIDFRLVLSDGTTLDTYTNTPTLTVTLNPDIVAPFDTGTLQYGGGVHETSAGDIYAVYVDGGSLVITKDPAGTPSTVQSETPTNIFGGGGIKWVDSAIDGNDKIHVILQADTDTTRDVAYRVLDTATDTWDAAWEEAYAYTGVPADERVTIAIDSSNIPHIITTDLQGGVDQIIYANRVGGTWGNVENLSGDNAENYSDAELAFDGNGDLHAWYYADGFNDPAYRKRTGTTWGGETVLAWTLYVNIRGITVDPSGNRYEYVVMTPSGGTNLELEDIKYTVNEGAETDAGFNTIITDEHLPVLAAFYAQSTELLIYIGTNGNLQAITDDGGGWQGEQLQQGSYEYVVGAWQYNHWQPTTSIPFLWSDGTDVYYDTYDFSAGTQDDLTTDDTTTGAPDLGNPTLTQEHSLSTGNTDTAAPDLQSPAISQEHALSATNLDTAAPDLESPALTETHQLSTDDTATGAPDLQSPAISQEHSLPVANTDTGDPDLQSPAISQEHALSATNLETAAPDLESPALAESHQLSTDDTATAAPDLQSPAISQEHALSATNLDTAEPDLQSPAITQEHALSTTNLETATPDLGSPSLSESHQLPTDDTVTGAPDLQSPAISQEHTLSATNLDTAEPDLQSPGISQEHALATTNLETAAPDLGNPTLSESGTDALTADNMATGAPDLESPAISQEHGLSAGNLETAAPDLGNPALSTDSTDALTADNLETPPPDLASPQFSQVHILSPNADLITGAPDVGNPTITQQHNLSIGNLDTADPTLPEPSLTERHNLGAADLDTAAPTLGSPAIGQIHALQADALATPQPTLQSPAIGQIHVLTAPDLNTGNVTFGNVSMEFAKGLHITAISAQRARATITPQRAQATITSQRPKAQISAESS